MAGYENMAKNMMQKRMDQVGSNMDALQSGNADQYKSFGGGGNYSKYMGNAQAQDMSQTPQGGTPGQMDFNGLMGFLSQMGGQQNRRR